MGCEFRIELSPDAEQILVALETRNPKKHKKVLTTLGYMQTNLRHQSLQTHKYNEIEGPDGQEMFESYVENKTPGAYRVFWYYGPGQGVITVYHISPHP